MAAPSAGGPPALTASIVTYRSGPVIASCLRHLQASTGRPLEIVVFDNASDDDTRERLRPFAGEVRLIASPENIGFGQGHNRALAGAAGRHFLLLNPDVELPAGGLDRLADHLDAHPECGAVAPLLAEDGGRKLGGHERRYPGQGRLPPDWRALPGKIAILKGACLLVRGDLFRRIGGFDRRYFLYGEDLDLCLQIRRAGFALECLEGVVARHLGGHSESGRSAASVARRQYAGLIAFYRKNYPRPVARWLLRRDLLRFGFRWLCCRLLPGRRAKAAEYGGKLRAWRDSLRSTGY